VLDPAILEAAQGHGPMAPARLWFLAESLVELAARWRAAGSRLLILQGDPAALLPRLVQQLGATVVAWNRDVEPAGRERDRAVARALQAAGRRVQVDWDQLLVPPEALKTGAGEPYRVYGPYWRSWQRVVTGTPGGVDPLPAPSSLIDLSVEQLAERDLGAGERALEALRRDHGFAGVDLCPCRPGEAAAAEQARINGLAWKYGGLVGALSADLARVGWTIPCEAETVTADLLQRDLAGALTADQKDAKANVADTYMMLSGAGISNADIAAIWERVKP
jgi:hypothetical protein